MARRELGCGYSCEESSSLNADQYIDGDRSKANAGSYFQPAWRIDLNSERGVRFGPASGRVVVSVMVVLLGRIVLSDRSGRAGTESPRAPGA
jgi:hypothetical protein